MPPSYAPALYYFLNKIPLEKRAPYIFVFLQHIRNNIPISIVSNSKCFGIIMNRKEYAIDARELNIPFSILKRVRYPSIQFGEENRARKEKTRKLYNFPFSFLTIMVG